MARFCTNCGTPLPEGADFCPECGARVSGTRQPGIVIDAPPGSTVTISDRPPAPGNGADPRTRSGVHSSSASRGAVEPNRSSAGRGEAVPVRSSRSSRPEQAGAAQGPKTGRGTRFLSFILVVAMLAELGIAGFKYPGFLRSRESSGDGTSVSLRPTASAAPVPTGGSGGIGTPTGSGADAAFDEEEDSPFTEAISLRYTPEQIASAPAVTAEVSWQEPVVQAGEVEVLLNSWNLDEETDTLVVKALPELSAGEEGWCIRAYDFSLASGQHEFPTDVAITIPRETEGLLGGCVWYNAAEDRWEDVYSEPTEDGAGYTLYVDHFSLLGEKTYKFDPDLLELVDSDGFKVNLKSGVLVLVPSQKKNSMEWKVAIDWNRLWNQYQKKDKKDMDALGEKMEKLFAPSISVVEAEKTELLLNEWHDLVGTGGMLDGTVSGLGDFIEALNGAGLGKTFMILDIVLTNLKVITEMRKGNKDVVQMIKAYPEACWKYKQEISGLTLTALAAACCANWVAAVVGILWWSGTNIYNKMTDRMYYETKSKPTLEEMYRQYYTSTCYRIDFGSPAVLKPTVKGSEFRYLTMDMGEMLDDSVMEAVRKAVNQKGLKIVTSTSGKSPAFSRGWADALTAILKTCSDDPEYLSQTLDDFYLSYARAFWSMPEDKQEAFVHRIYWLGGEEGEAACLELLRNASLAERTRITAAFVDLLKAGTYEILREAAAKIQHESCQNLKKEVEKQLLPILNTQLVFHVEDTALKDGETLQDSIYGENWKRIPENSRYINGGEGVRYDEPALITPMRFGGDPVPLFLPLIPRDTRDPSKDSYNNLESYYPYTPEFLPQAPDKGDVVYRCTYYHYVMMGSPKTMLFRETQDRANYADLSGVPAEIKLPKMTGQKKADVYIRVKGGKRQEAKAVTFEDLVLKKDSLLVWDTKTAPFGELLSEQEPAGSSVSIDEKGSVTIRLAGVELKGSRIEEEDGENFKAYYTSRRESVTLTGKADNYSAGLDDTFTGALTGVSTLKADHELTGSFTGSDESGTFSITAGLSLKPESAAFSIWLQDGQLVDVTVTLKGKLTIRRTTASSQDAPDTKTETQTAEITFKLIPPGGPPPSSDSGLETGG